jgi:hypothetical protein
LLEYVGRDVAEERALVWVLVCPSGELIFRGGSGLSRRTHGRMYALAQLWIARECYINLGRMGN